MLLVQSIIYISQYVAMELAGNFDDVKRESRKSMIREMGYSSTEEDLVNKFFNT